MDLKSQFMGLYMNAKKTNQSLKEKWKDLENKEGVTFNTAKSSLSGLSSTLEKRRQQFKEARLQK